MNNKKKLNIILLIMAALLSAGCNADKLKIKPFFNPNNNSDAFFQKPVVLNSANDFLTLHRKTWEFGGTDLKREKYGNKVAINCPTLKNLLNRGYTVVKAYKYKLVSAQSVICSMWKEMATFKPYSISFMDNLSLNKAFATKAPARFALLISNEEIKKTGSASSWNSLSRISKVEPVSDLQAIYHDDSAGIQRLTLMAKGDYNDDGIEDWLLYMENSVEGGSYSSTAFYIITRTAPGEPISLLKEV